MAGEFRDTDPEEQRNDHWALRHGYVAITPVTVDATDYEMIKRMNHWFEA
jgi:5'-nucleotidase